MTAIERVARILSAVNAIADMRDVTINVSSAEPEDRFLELAKAPEATVRGHAVIYADSPSLAVDGDAVPHHVERVQPHRAQGTRPATPAEIEQACICESDAPVTPERRAAALEKLAKARAK